jgi:AraC-like DNA-binding protein
MSHRIDLFCEDLRRQHEARGGGQGGGARVRPISGSFLARLPSHAGSGAARLSKQRVVLSKEKLRDDGLSLSDVATECRFSDQSHSRQFSHRRWA